MLGCFERNSAKPKETVSENIVVLFKHVTPKRFDDAREAMSLRFVFRAQVFKCGLTRSRRLSFEFVFSKQGTVWFLGF